MSIKLSSSSWLVIKFIIGSIVMSLTLYCLQFLDHKEKEEFVITEQFMPKESRAFYKKLNSRRKQIIANDLQKDRYLGVYKLNELDLALTGYYLPDALYCDNEWRGIWTNKYKIKSKNDFILAPLIQDLIVSNLSAVYSKDIYYYGLDKYIDNKKVSVISLVAVMHLYDLYEVLDFFYNKSDNTSIEQDLERFATFNILIEVPENYSRIDSILSMFKKAKCYQRAII